MATTTKKRLTNQVLERMNPPKAGRLELGDELCPGLVLRVTEQGAKSFSVIYRVLGEGGETDKRPTARRQAAPHHPGQVAGHQPRQREGPDAGDHRQGQ